MPKFVGRRITGATEIEANAERTELVRLTYSQAKLLPSNKVLCSLNTSDRGSIGRVAKRWYTWFAHPLDILECEQSTANMALRARAVLTIVARKNLSALGE
jgi:hypothetical protein